MLALESLEERCLLSASGFRPIDEVGNNIANPTEGTAGTDLLRVSPVAYADGLNSPSQPNTLSPRQISNSLNNQSNPIFSFADNLGSPQSKSLSDFAYVWGQFIDHDMDLTPTSSGQPFNIPGDQTLSSDPMGIEGFLRSTFDPATGPSAVDLSGAFNRVGIVNDGSTFSGGGLDHDGFALSANLLGSSVGLTSATYVLGDAGVNDVVSAAGQTIHLPAGNDASVSFLATGVNGNQPNQTFKITYTDGSTQTFTQSISDWFTPQNFPGESTAVTMPYRDTANGSRDSRTFQIYAYSLTLNPAKQVKSITLPNDRNVEVLAIDVTPDSPRQQVNADTSFLDLSQVYGSTDAVADSLRIHSGGLLKTSPGGLLPYDNTTYFTPAQIAALNMANDAQQVATSSLFAAGDVRANENIELTAMQTLFVRNHNRLAEALQQLHPNWSDEQLYQEARKLNIATEEMITYNEFLPAILGPNTLTSYNGYNPNVDPAIDTEFSTVAFRFGHSLLSSTVGRDKNDGTGIADVNPNGAGVNLAEDFFRPDLITPNGTVAPLVDLNGNPDPHTSSNIGAILKADADGAANEMDLPAIDEVRSLLFGIPNAPGTDLIARDIQRARDDGIGTYNQVRVAFNLPAVTSYAQISSDPTVQAAFRATYGTNPDGTDNVNAIDPLEGMFAEDHVSGGDVGPTIKAILADQFQRLRDGDRFFYLNESFNSEEQNLLAQGNTLAKVIEANTSITNLQSNVFYFKESIAGTVFDDDDPTNLLDPANVGLAGVTVNLNDNTGAVVASTTTDSQGHYRFTDQTGIPGTGKCTVSVVLPAGFTNVTAASIPVALTRGGMAFGNMNFGIEETSSVLTVSTIPSGGGISTGSATTVGSGSGAAAFASGSAMAVASPSAVAGGQASSSDALPGTSGDSALIGFFQQGESALTGSGTVSTVPAVTPGTPASLRQSFIDGSTGFGAQSVLNTNSTVDTASQSADPLAGVAGDAQNLGALPSTGSSLGSP